MCGVVRTGSRGDDQGRKEGAREREATPATYSFMVDRVWVAGGGGIPPVRFRRDRG